MEKTINSKKLFILSCVSLIVTSMSFALRARIEPVFISDFALSKTDIGIAFGPAFYGFTLAMIILGPLVDLWGMKRVLWIAFFCHLIGITGTIFSNGLWPLFASTLAFGIGNGAVEAACNPLVATIFPKAKTKMLNRFHVWFPGGIVIGSILAYLLIDVIDLNWQAFVAVLYIPLAIYGFMLIKAEFPKTERVASGISTANMWKALGTPIFIFMGICMLLTASTELATQQRITSLLADANAQPMLVLALTTGLMAVGRAFAGPVVHKLSSSGLLLASAVLAFFGLIWLSFATGITVYFAAIVFAAGVCFFWPTMIGFVAEYIPESGALGMSVMGGLGMFSVSIVLPVMGVFMDTGSQGTETLRYMAILPAILAVLFIFLFVKYRSKKVVELN
ncbi:MFS transporter [Prolixibacteraceae bacterium JC049]|nr:MFS transporter [Prolixibacteraceae bacterium JC049]